MQETDTDEELDKFEVKCPQGFKRRLRIEAAKGGLTMSEYVRESLRAVWDVGSPVEIRALTLNDGSTEPSIDSEGPENSQNTEESEVVHKDNGEK